MKSLNIVFKCLLICFFFTTNLLMKCREMEESSILELNDENFGDAVKKYSNLLVQFYNPEKTESKDFESEFLSAESMLKEEDFSITLGRMNAQTCPITSENYGINKFPEVKLFV